MSDYIVNYIKSPVNYIGGKTKILPQILPLFPADIEGFFDVFSGGCNVGINVNSKNIYFNDNLNYLIDMFSIFNEKGFEFVVGYVDFMIESYGLTKDNRDGYNKFRDKYNKEKYPLDLFVLIAYSFNHQIRFNGKHEFNNPFGKDKSSFNANMRNNLKDFCDRLVSINAKFTSYCFTDFDFSKVGKQDFVYFDPPYLITQGTYNDGKRGFKGWGNEQEFALLDIISDLDQKGIRFAFSNVLEHNEKENKILKDWLGVNSNFKVNYISKSYSNSNYQKKIKSRSLEVLITNYII